MFRDIVQPSTGVGGRKRYVVPLSIATHIVLIAIAIMVPLLAPGVLPVPAATLIAWVRPLAADVPLPPAPTPPPSPSPRNRGPVPDPDSAAAPIEAPPAIAPESAVRFTVVPIGVVEGVDGTLSDQLGKRVEPVALPPPPAAPVEPLHVGGKVKPPKKINDAQPIYPVIARQAHVEGMVIIQATIGPGGDVVDATVLRSYPLLDDAALNAVRQWRYTPTLLNGLPVPVVMTVTVTFALR
jgi:protein TonB